MTVTTTTIAVGKGCNMIAKITDYLQSPFLLIIRLYIGYQCVISGWGHLTHFQKTVSFFRDDLHIPMAAANAAFSGSAELIAGGFLLAGLFSRVAALVLAGNFFVAILTVELSNSNFSLAQLGRNIWNDQGTYLFNDTAFPFFATAVIVLLFGPGMFSIDGLVKWSKRKTLAKA
jgi:putative oxidoreductase